MLFVLYLIVHYKKTKIKCIITYLIILIYEDITLVFVKILNFLKCYNIFGHENDFLFYQTLHIFLILIIEH